MLPNLLIALIIIVLVITFFITIAVLNANTKKLIEANLKLVDKQDEQKEIITSLMKQHEEMADKLKESAFDEVAALQAQTREQRKQIELTADMSDGQLFEWLDRQMDETQLFTDPDLTLKTLAKRLGLTQRRLSALFKNNERYARLGDYLNEKRFLLACRLLREHTEWTVEAVGMEAGFGGRRTFQNEVKRRLGITPIQYRQGVDFQTRTRRNTQA